MTGETNEAQEIEILKTHHPIYKQGKQCGFLSHESGWR